MISFIRRHPFFPVAITLMVGITCSSMWPGAIPLSLLHTSFAILFLGSVVLQSLAKSRTRHLQTVVLFLAFFVLGYTKYYLDSPANQKDHVSHLPIDGKNSMVAEVIEIMTRRLIVDVQQLNGHKCRGKVILYSQNSFKPGDLFVADVNVKDITNPKNPFAFDYQSYMRNKGILLQASFIQKPILVGRSSSFKYWMNKTRSKCRSLLRKLMTGDNEYELASALVLGYKKDLNSELKNAFADTGSMHILAVSGLHVGVVYMLIMFLFRSLLPSTTFWRITRSFLVLLGLWFFVYLVGAPISAGRAALMFTLFEIGNLTSRGHYPINTLAVAAFILLLINSYSLFDLSFQLSFLAVLGIVSCQRKIQEFWKINNRIGLKLWQLTSLSISAQIFTLPLTIYYFHQFPLYFWLSGLLAVPMAFILLSSTLVFFMMSWLPVVGLVIGYISFGAAYVLNAWVFLVQQLPGLTISGIWLHTRDVYIILGASLGLVFWLNTKKLKYFNGSLALLSCLLISLCLQRIEQLGQKVIVFYYDRTHDFADLFLGETVYPLFAEPASEALPNYVAETREGMGASQTGNIQNQQTIFSNGKLLKYNSTLIALSQESLTRGQVPELKYAFLRDEISTDDLTADHAKVTFILGASLPYGGYRIKRSIADLGCRYYDIAKDGAFVLDLKRSQ